MRVKGWLGVFGGGLLAAVAAPVVAHHSFAAEFDINRPIKLDGVVTKMQFSNPHSWLHIEVTTATGEKQQWTVEGGAPNALIRTAGTATRYLPAPRCTSKGSRRRTEPSARAAATSRCRTARRCSWARVGRRRRAPSNRYPFDRRTRRRGRELRRRFSFQGLFAGVDVEDFGAFARPAVDSRCRRCATAASHHARSRRPLLFRRRARPTANGRRRRCLRGTSTRTSRSSAAS